MVGDHIKSTHFCLFAKPFVNQWTDFDEFFKKVIKLLEYELIAVWNQPVPRWLLQLINLSQHKNTLVNFTNIELKFNPNIYVDKHSSKECQFYFTMISLHLSKCVSFVLIVDTHLADSFHSSSSPSRCRVSISVKSVGVGRSSSSLRM